MIRVECNGTINTQKIVAAADKASLKALPKAAAYVRGVARRKVKRRKHKSSVPGQPPVAHSNVFKASILYGVNTSEVSAFVGPQRLHSQRTNHAGQPVPEILEFGGMAALGMNPNWIHRRVPRGIRTESDIANYFAGLGRGPAYWGFSLSSVQAKMNRGGRGKSEEAVRTKGGSGSNSQYQRYRRFSPVKGRQVYLASIKIRTQKQAQKVAKTVVDVFGYPVTNRPIKIAPRPLMGPSLEDSRSTLAHFWSNTVK